MEIIMVLTVGALCIGCFLIGASVGQKVTKGEDIKLPTVNPIQAIKENRDKKQAEMEQHKFDTILQNIDKYDGTTKGQEDVP